MLTEFASSQPNKNHLDQLVVIYSLNYILELYLPNETLIKSISLLLMLFRLFTASTDMVYCVEFCKSVILNIPASVLDWLYMTVFSVSFIATTYFFMLLQLAFELCWKEKYKTLYGSHRSQILRLLQFTQYLV